MVLSKSYNLIGIFTVCFTLVLRPTSRAMTVLLSSNLSYPAIIWYVSYWKLQGFYSSVEVPFWSLDGQNLKTFGQMLEV